MKKYLLLLTALTSLGAGCAAQPAAPAPQPAPAPAAVEPAPAPTPAPVPAPAPKAVVKPSLQPSGSPTTKPGPKTWTVSIMANSFEPQLLAVREGDTVVWTNKSTVSHTVAGDVLLWDSGNLSPGQSYRHTFPAAGTNNYHCAIHPNMKAQIVVYK